MKIVAISDTHNRHEELTIPDGDVFIHAGDATNKSSEPELNDFLDWMTALPQKHKIFIPGNHDRRMVPNLDDWRTAYPDIHILTHDLRVLDGVRFYGCWSMGDYGESPTSSLPCDVFVTHNAPHGILDLAPQRVQSAFGPPLDDNIGEKKIHQAVMNLKPAHHIFGHIHMHGGRKCISSSTIFHNVAAMDQMTDSLRKPLELWI